MTRFCYDLHIHSCLSPCGSDEATPAAIAGMAKVAGLDIAALTDHNSVKNCPAFFRAAEAYGLTPVAGMELTTAEDIHLVCLFPTLESALAFGEAVDARRIKVRNRPEIFGNQLVMNEEDEVIAREEHLLINATTLTLLEGYKLARSYGGAALPAHIDREANGIIAILGGFPEEPHFPAYELHDASKYLDYRDAYRLTGRRVVFSSDAHDLMHIAEPEHVLVLDAEPGDDAAIRNALIRFLRGEEPT